MPRELRALVVEDEEDDALLVVAELRRGGFDVTFERVDSAEQMSAALAREPWDVVISDYTMPRFDALQALAVVRQASPGMPFIVVSGTVSEDAAVEVIRAGAHDFMSKGRFARLVPAVERELRDAAMRTERSKMAQQLVVSDRMASMGTLVAGVAHEINNPLAALIANLEFVADDLAKLAQDQRAADWLPARIAEMEEPLRDSRDSAERVRLIVRDLKLFSRADDEARGAVDLRGVLRSSLRMAWNEIRHKARLVEEYGDVPRVEGTDAQLGQVFLNQILNAAQSIAPGHADANAIRVVTRRDEAGRVVTEIHDTGAGIPESVLPRIFDPFFTTKPIGVGTGLGLSICHGIVTSLGGEITVESRVGRGTVVRTVLPAAPEPVIAARTQAVMPSATAPRGRILVVDDEPLMGAVITRILTADHDVVALTRARDAVDRFQKGERFDVILCDLMMPELTGMDLLERITEIAPEQAARMVFVTGGAFTPGSQEFLARVQNPILEKPFSAAALRTLIGELLLPPAGK